MEKKEEELVAVRRGDHLGEPRGTICRGVPGCNKRDGIFDFCFDRRGGVDGLGVEVVGRDWLLRETGSHLQ